MIYFLKETISGTKHWITGGVDNHFSLFWFLNIQIFRYRDVFRHRRLRKKRSILLRILSIAEQHLIRQSYSNRNDDPKKIFK